MTDKSLIERLNWMIKVAPQENDKKTQKSWSWGSERKSLTTEEKLYAISNGFVANEEGFMPRERERKKWKEIIRKYLKKCPWGVPWMMIVFSVVQLFFNTFNSSDKTYQLLAFSTHHKSEIWRFFTYSLLHAGTAHLIINIILQLVISLPLETETGHFRTFFVYFGGVLSGSLAASLKNDGLLMVGASSGIYSLLMSHLAHVYLNFQTISHRTYRIIFVVILTLSDVIHSLSHCLLNNNEEPKIHIVAHISGAICGIILGFIFYKKSKTDNDDAKGAKYFKWISIACYLTFICFVIIVHVS
ncbi:rhomboid-related protein 1-like [Chironomus tepperi]|uniref:rhomboid-related protein 1-like n=1 Tax=Chironomus tepperi TaxID=113505 RepID=UPI00391F5A82